jgi:RNA polymerase sigma-70 factor (ECF subfamily)
MKTTRLTRDTFESVVREYAKAVFNIAFRIVNDYEDAMDIAQTTFLKVYENIDSYDPSHAIFSWLYRIAANESINLIKRKKRTVPLDNDLGLRVDGPESEYAQNETSRRLQQALMTLSIEYRTVLILRHFQDLSYREIADILGVPEKTVRSRIFTGRQHLRDSLLKQGYTS